ncbi:hypothetical protein [Amycolatopsis sp. NPDC051716]|uniref:hypothetical protein n=1 Tax=Actinomycetes TaxID=1760 RepID=UPI003440A4B7
MHVKITESQGAVLAVLEPGGMLTIDQIARAAQLTTYRTRSAVSALKSRGLICSGSARMGRYQITDSGHRAYAAHGRVAR